MLFSAGADGFQRRCSAATSYCAVTHLNAGRQHSRAEPQSRTGQLISGTGGLLGSGQQLVLQNLRYCCVVSLMPPPSVLALSRRPRASRAVGMGEQVPHATRGRGERSRARLARFSQCACWRVGAASAALGAAMAEEALSLG